MKDRDKKIWIAFLVLLLCAVVIGLFYWKGQQQVKSD